MLAIRGLYENITSFYLSIFIIYISIHIPDNVTVTALLREISEFTEKIKLFD